jgi:outer membrane receptor protein involved in Fe transport
MSGETRLRDTAAAKARRPLRGVERKMARRSPRQPPDGSPDPGPEAQRLAIAGYAIVNLRASWKPGADWELYATLNNAFDRRCENFGALGTTVFSPAGAYTGVERQALFVAPVAPRNLWTGLRYRF